MGDTLPLTHRPIWTHTHTNIRRVGPEAGVKGKDKYLQPTVSVACNYVFLSLIPGTTLLIYIYIWLSQHGHLSSTWWRHQMEAFSAWLAICAGNSPVPGELPAQRPVTRSFDVFFDLRLNKRLSKQSRGWWFETPSRSLWRHRKVISDTP